MSTWAPLMVNEEMVAGVTIRRLSPERPTPDHVFIYEYTVNYRGTHRGQVRHRYGDGLLVLWRKVLIDATAE